MATSLNEASSAHAIRATLTDQEWTTRRTYTPSSDASVGRKRRVSTPSAQDPTLSSSSAAASRMTQRLSRAASSTSHLALHPHRRPRESDIFGNRSLSASSLFASADVSSGPMTLSALVYDAMLSSKAGLRRVFHTYDQFPAYRYVFVREWEHPSVNTNSPSVSASGSRERSLSQGQSRNGANIKHQVLHSVIALDRVDGKHVVLTCLAKAIVTEWQIHHALRVMLTLARKVGFQALLRVWDADKNWVFVQEFDPEWECVDTEFKTVSTAPAKAGFSEEKLREIVFQVVAHVHFLHSHELSMAGELWHHDLMIKHGKVSLLFNITYILSGYTLVPANERNKAADIAAIGMLMFQLCMVPFAPEGSSFDISSIEDAIEDQLSHVSAPCRDTLFDCLTAKPTIDELSKRKWLRHIDFISVASKLEHSHSSLHMRKMLYNSLMWKLAAFFMADWLDNFYNVAAVPSVSNSEDEETRQRLKKPSKRVLIGRKLLLSGHSPHWLKRGAAIIPPLGSTILPHREDDDQADVVRRYGDNQMDSVFQSWTHDEIIPGSGSSGYSAFAYDFPSSYSSYEPVYDAFEWTEDGEYAQEREGVESSAIDGESGTITLARKASLLGFSTENNHSQEFQRETLRSLMVDGTIPRSDRLSASSYSNSAAEASVAKSTSSTPQVPFSPETSMDPLYFSAFGPKDITYRESFRVDIWAYLRQQRDEMLQTALEQNEAEVGQHVQPFHIQRGTLITVMLEANDHFGIHGDDSKTFRWRGDVSGVSFELYRKQTNIWNREEDEEESESELCIARIIAGTKVSLLYIRLHTAQQRGDTAEFSILESNLEHVSAEVHEIPSQDLEIIRPVGSGAFGDAMLAKWHNNKTEVVVKTLHKDMYRNSDAVAEFQHEAAVMHMLGKHPHVVELLGICSNFSTKGADSSFSLVTEYLPNGSLQDVLRTSPRHGYHQQSHNGDEFAMLYDSSTSSLFGLFSRTVMARDAAHGLANIHQGHFLHRDIAARNCLVDDHFRVKVCDFGLSRKLNPSGFMFDDDRHGFGPLKWMAPESILPPHLFSMQSDSYMFGVLMYEIFTGEQPFPALSTRDAIALIREGKHVPIPSGLPATHAKLMQHCFELHPLHRPTMDQIYSTLDGWILQDTKTHVVI